VPVERVKEKTSSETAPELTRPSKKGVEPAAEEKRRRKERKGKERKGKERKGKERKGKERKGKERGDYQQGRNDIPLPHKPPTHSPIQRGKGTTFHRYRCHLHWKK